VGFAIASFTMFTHAQERADVIQALLYAVPAVAAFGALILLPFRAERP
jgi:NADH:ubiquinone oxidoreductase subunit 2 (subunit N)